MKYMIIDVTTPVAVRVLKVAEMANCQLWGQIYQAEGKKVIAPPVEGRGFSKLDLNQLQYLFWNANQTPPPADYPALVKGCLDAVDAMEVDHTDTAWLQSEVDRILPDPNAVAAATDGASDSSTRAPKPPKVPKEPKAPAEAGGRPKANSMTGLVWDLADQAYATAVKEGEEPDWKTVRAELTKLCVHEGINAGTMGVQYGKWKASKLAT